MIDFPLLHERTKQSIAQLIKNPSHAVALIGETGAGKSYLARYLAEQMLRSDTSPYVHWVDASVPKIGIDAVREAQQFLTLTVPGRQKIKRVLIIEHLDLLGIEAQNALLKTLEEPPLDTVVIVTYARSELVLATIESRITSVQVLPVNEMVTTTYFNETPTDIVHKAYMISEGNVGLLTSLINNDQDHPLLSGIEIARELLQSTRYQRLAQTEKLLKQTTVSVAMILDGLYRLLNVAYHQSMSKKNNAERKVMSTRIDLVEHALTDLQSGVQAKLVLNRLFLEL